MSAAPIFFGTVRAIGAGTVPGTADTSLTAPTNVTTILTAATAGTKIEQIRITQVATTSSAGLVNLFLYDGSAYHLFDQYAFSTLTLSSSVRLTPVDLYYANLVLSSGWSLRASVSVPGGVSAFKVLAFGGDA